MALAPSTSAPTFSNEEPTLCALGPSATTGTLRTSLRERRKSPAALDMGTITSSSRDDMSHKAAVAVFRGWEPTTEGGSVEQLLDPMNQNPGALRVMSYNILASRYTSTDKYGTCPVFALAEPYRLNNIASEIRGADADIVILEECSTKALQLPELGGALATMGYKWYHVPITTDKKERLTSNSQGSGNWEPSQQPDHEGVAICYRSTRFESEEDYPLRYNTLAQRDPKLQAEEKRRVMVNSHNVAAVCVLRDTVTEMRYIVGGIHCFWDTAKPECQLYQIVHLVEQMKVMEEVYSNMGDTALILGGDFNAELHAPSIRYLLTGMSDPSVQQFPATHQASHEFGFETAYGEYVQNRCRSRVDGVKPHVTAVGNAFAGVIDHIFFQAGKMRCRAVAKLAPAADIPNTSVPSDHLPVCAWLTPVM